MCGWIKIYRDLLKWGWIESPKHLAVFIHLLLKANHEEKVWMKQVVKKGQLITGTHKLAAEVGISRQSLRTILSDLKSTNEITIKSTTKYSIISITNWEKYQKKDSDFKKINQQTDQQSTNDQPTTNHKQECKELKNEKKERILKENIKRKTFEIEKNILEYWNSKNLKIWKGTDRQFLLIEKNLKKFKKSFQEPELLDAIDNYSKVLMDNSSWYTHKYNLGDFISRGYQKFLRDEFSLDDFKNRSKNRAQQKQDNMLEIYKQYSDEEVLIENYM